jgi:hypothetical protein
MRPRRFGATRLAVDKRTLRVCCPRSQRAAPQPAQLDECHAVSGITRGVSVAIIEIQQGASVMIMRWSSPHDTVLAG